MNLKIDCEKFQVRKSSDTDGNIEIEIENEVVYPGQLEHYLDYLSEKYGRDLVVAVKNRFGLVEE